MDKRLAALPLLALVISPQLLSDAVLLPDCFPSLPQFSSRSRIKQP